MGRPNIRPTLAIGLSAYRAYRGHYPAATHWQMPKPKPRPSGTSSDLQWSIPEKPSAVAQNTKKTKQHRAPWSRGLPRTRKGPFLILLLVDTGNLPKACFFRVQVHLDDTSEAVAIEYGLDERVPICTLKSESLNPQWTRLFLPHPQKRCTNTDLP